MEWLYIIQGSVDQILSDLDRGHRGRVTKPLVTSRRGYCHQEGNVDTSSAGVQG